MKSTRDFLALLGLLAIIFVLVYLGFELGEASACSELEKHNKITTKECRKYVE